MKPALTWRGAAACAASLAALLLCSTSGCEASISSVCDAFCDCKGCLDSEYEQCVTDNEAGARLAQDQGCTDQVDAYLICVDDKLACVEDEVEIIGCNSELDELADCAGAVLGFGGCELGARKLEECLGEGAGAFGECTPDIECTLNCVASATCEELTMGSEELNRCFSECSGVVQPGGGSGGAGGGPSPPPPDGAPPPSDGPPSPGGKP